MVPVPILATGTVPDAILEPFKFVKFAPLIAAIVPVKFAAGRLVSDAPEPLKVVALAVPVMVTPELVVSNFFDPLWYKSTDPLYCADMRVSDSPPVT